MGHAVLRCLCAELDSNYWWTAAAFREAIVMAVHCSSHAFAASFLASMHSNPRINDAP